MQTNLKLKAMKTEKLIPTTKSHFDKYDEIVKKKYDLTYAIPATKKEIIEAIEAGDFALNTIKLPKWDGRAHNVGATAWRDGKAFKSLAEQVCTLKHFAIYHLAGYKPQFKD